MQCDPKELKLDFLDRVSSGLSTAEAFAGITTAAVTVISAISFSAGVMLVGKGAIGAGKLIGGAGVLGSVGIVFGSFALYGAIDK